MSEIKFDKEYFDNLMEQSTNEELAKQGKQVEKIFRNFSDNQLISLFNLDGADFYKRVLFLFGTLRFNKATMTDEDIKKGIEEIKIGMGLDDAQAIAYLREQGLLGEEVNGQSTIKLVCGKLLGFVKFVWDTTLICTGLTVRVGVKFVSNLFKAVVDTGKYAVSEGKAAGGAIKDSWDRNLK